MHEIRLSKDAVLYFAGDLKSERFNRVMRLFACFKEEKGGAKNEAKRNRKSRQRG